MLRYKKYIFISVILLILEVQSSWVLAWDNLSTHKQLSDRAISQSLLKDDKDSFLINFIGISQGTNTILHWDGGIEGTEKNIVDWIKDGAIFEDNGTRALNHFHNPLLPWIKGSVKG